MTPEGAPVRLSRAPPLAPSGGEASRPAIGDYAIIGDCRTAALVSRNGSIDWLCLPHFSGPSVFAALLDRRRSGSLEICPAATPFTARRRYLGPSAVLETTFRTAEGVARVTDAMSVPEDPGALRPLREVLRVVEGVEGTVELRIVFAPRPDYGRVTPRLIRRGALGWACAWGDELLLLHADVPLEPTPDGTVVAGTLRVEAGQRRALSLSYVKADIGVIAPLGSEAERRLRATLSWWEGWAAGCRYDGPWRDAVLRSAVTLKLLIFAPSGAVVAAPTASLPEWVGADRNWDYRYCWLRDAALTMRAFTGLGLHEEARAFLGWMLHATRLTWPELQIMYDVYGRTNLTEGTLDHFEGHHGSRPVRIGNAAHSQIQLDVYGEVVLAAHDYVVAGGRLQRDEARVLAGLGRTVARRWREPDQGIWEARGAPRQYTFSKVLCWLALDRLLDFGARGMVRVPAEVFRRERAAVAEVIEARGFNPAVSSYVGELEGDAPDASLLLMACLGYRPASDPRMRGTYDFVQRRLGCGHGLLYRYESGYDGIASPEGAFGICSFWAADNLAARGEPEAAERAFADLLSFGNDVGLFAEETDPGTGAALGNFPQAFTHVGLINAALAIARARRGDG